VATGPTVQPWKISLGSLGTGYYQRRLDATISGGRLH